MEGCVDAPVTRCGSFVDLPWCWNDVGSRPDLGYRMVCFVASTYRLLYIVEFQTFIPFRLTRILRYVSTPEGPLNVW